jgi:acyl-CoA thioester hydrolase
MSKIFTRTFRARWGELDPSGTVSPANYLRYLIETAWDWGTAIGWGEKYSQNPDVFWVIRETEIRFQRPLRHNDVFDFTIWMVNWQRVRGTRCFELKLKESGEVIAQGTQQVVYMDTKTGRPISLSEEEIVKFRHEDPRVFPFERFPKIAAVENTFVTQRSVFRRSRRWKIHLSHSGKWNGWTWTSMSMSTTSFMSIMQRKPPPRILRPEAGVLPD